MSDRARRGVRERKNRLEKGEKRGNPRRLGGGGGGAERYVKKNEKRKQYHRRRNLKKTKAYANLSILPTRVRLSFLSVLITI